MVNRGLPWWSVAKTPSSNAGAQAGSQAKLRACMQQLRDVLQLAILHATTKTQPNQINTVFKK